MTGPDRITRCTGFDGDDANVVEIWDSHRVSPLECEEAFFNEPLVVGFDAKRSRAEVRDYVLGRTGAGRLLFVVVTVRRDLLRVVSTRDMSRKERKVYASA